jgi:DNA-binding NarL/FixJ family response regulator
MVDVWLMAPSPVRRGSLLRTLNGDQSIRVMGTASTFPILRSLMSDIPAEVAVIDLSSPMDSATLRGWLDELLDLVPIIVLSSEPDPVIFSAMLDAKAGGLLPSEASAEQIIQAIRSVTSGLMIFDGTLTRHLIPSSDQEHAIVEPLTPRETEVLELLAEGLGNKEIAARLNVSEHTIKFHIRSILAKLGASSRTEAVTRGLRSGLIEL